MQYRFRPIVTWPTAHTARRRRSPFRAGYQATLDLLAAELRQLIARDVVVQVALSEQDIRNDGMPRLNARPPAHPGVILSFESKHGPLSYPCDTFDRWEDNLRAIALALEHLRAVDRYGVTRRGEQYTGWKTLPAPGDAGITVEESVALLRTHSNGQPVSAATLAAVYRAAVMQTHPDRGGTPEQFERVQKARKCLEGFYARTA